MKKFFKALAVVMALTLVIGTIPASAATTGPKTAKKLYIGGAKGEDANGVKSSVKKSVSYAYLLGITKDQAADAKVTAKSSKKTIAKARNDKQRVYAKGIGKATVTLTYKGKDYKVKVTVKKNAEKVNFGGDWAKVEDTFEAEVGTEYTVSLPRLDGTTKLDTDKRRLEASDESVVIAPVEGQPRSYTVKFTKSGEFTVTGIAYQSETYSKATASKAVTVTVKAGDFSAKATGVKEIKVAGTGFTKDSVFTVTRGKNTDIKVTKATPNEDGTEVVLALDQKIVADSYTVKQKDTTNEFTFQGEDQRIDVFEIFENGETVFKNKTGTEVYAHYQILDQYGNPAHKDFNVTWSTGTGTGVANDISGEKEGLLTIRYTAANAVKSGNLVTVTGVHVKSGKSCFATMTVGSNLAASSVDIQGIVKKSDLTTSKEATINAGYKDNEYGIYMNLIDANGRELKFNDDLASQIYVINKSPLVVDLASELESITIDGKNYAYVPIRVAKTGLNTNVGGVATITFISSQTGQSVDYDLTVKGKGTLASFEITGTDGVISENKATKIYFLASDENGNKLTKFRDIAPYITISTEGLKLDENSDGDAVLTYTAKDNVASKDVDSHDSLTVIVSGGQVSPYAIEVRNGRYAQKITSVINLKDNLVFGDSTTINLDDENNWYQPCFRYYDQYGAAINKRNPDASTVEYNYYLVSWFDGKDTQTSNTLNMGGVRRAYYDATANNKLAYTANGNAYIEIAGNTVSAKLGSTDAGNKAFTAKVWFALAYIDDNGDQQIVSDSQYAVTFGLWSLEDVASYSLSYHDKDWNAVNALTTQDALHGFGFSLNGTLNNGKSVEIPAGYATINVVGEKYNNVAIVASGAAVALNGFEYTMPIVNDNIYTDPAKVGTNAFLNYNKLLSNGKYEDKAIDIRLQATVRAASGASIGVGAVKGTPIVKVPVWNLAAKLNQSVTFKAQGDIGWGPFNTTDGLHKIWFSAVDGSKKTSTVMADSGYIYIDDLKKVINKSLDSYGLAYPLSTTGDKAWKVSISKLTESATGLHSDLIDKLPLQKSTDGLYIENAEIGDTFVATMTGDDQTVEITFTVIDDVNAYVNSGNNVKINGWM